MLKFLVILLVARWPQLATAFKNGAPSSVCNDMTPHHSQAIAQDHSALPYRILAQETDENTVIVRVTGSSFAGLFLQARKEPSKYNSLIGAFNTHASSELVKTVDCSNVKNGAVTHTNNKQKNEVEVEWEPPLDFSGPVTFVGTVVHNYTTFWRNIRSQQVMVKQSVNWSKGSSSDSKIPNYLYQKCGSKSNCLGVPIGCIETRDCKMLVTVSPAGRHLYEFEMMALKSKYVAVGLSDDRKMGGDDVIECSYDDHRPGFEGVKAYLSKNVPNAKSNKRWDSTAGLTLLENKYSDGNVFCKVSIESDIAFGESRVNLDDNKYFLMLAAGSSTSENGVDFHDVGYSAALDSRQVADVAPLITPDEFYDGCDTHKNCFGRPDNCVSQQNCNMVVSVTVEGSKYTFKLKSKNGTYVAVGLSKDNKMGEDSVVECVREPGGNVKVYMSWNIAGVKANTRDKIDQSGVQVIKSSYTNGEIHCEFTRNMNTVVMDQSFDLSKEKYYLLLVAGSSLKERSVGYHDIDFVSSSSSILLSDVGTVGSTSKLFLRLHGSFMVIAWIGTASIGIVFARYFKQTWVESSLCSKDLWFAWHRFFMLTTWSLTIIAFALIFIDVGGWVEGNSQLHGILGCVTTLLCFFQPIGAAFRPHPNARNRPVFNWLHWLVGNSAHIFAIITIFFAVPLAKAELPDWLLWIVVAFVALYVLIHFILTIVGCLSDRKKGDRVNSFPMKDMNTSRNALNGIDRKQDAPFSSFRKFMLFIHIVSITGITAALVTIIALAPIEDQWSSLQKKLMSS